MLGAYVDETDALLGPAIIIMQDCVVHKRNGNSPSCAALDLLWKYKDTCKDINIPRQTENTSIAKMIPGDVHARAICT